MICALAAPTHDVACPPLQRARSSRLFAPIPRRPRSAPASSADVQTPAPGTSSLPAPSPGAPAFSYLFPVSYAPPHPPSTESSISLCTFTFARSRTSLPAPARRRLSEIPPPFHLRADFFSTPLPRRLCHCHPPRPEAGFSFVPRSRRPLAAS
jgi:hypothetical protein